VLHATPPVGARGAGRIRTAEWRFCRPLPYHLATAPRGGGRCHPARGTARESTLGRTVGLREGFHGVGARETGVSKRRHNVRFGAPPLCRIRSSWQLLRRDPHPINEILRVAETPGRHVEV